MNYQPIIGLEVHVELATKSKMFCGCPVEHFGVTPNIHTCPVCLGLPGALPVPNKKAVEWTILLGLTLGCKVNKESKFDRKNYFYPDLPKGYQISQYDEPIAVDGELRIKNYELRDRIIRIRRVHLEEDTGKLQHAEINSEKVSLVDFNRSGVPLVEIVTEPDFRSIEEVDIFLKKLQRIIRYLGISGADMEKGSMRLEPSISISASRKPLQDLVLQRPSPLPPYRVELKNINSFRFVRKALEYEIKRQTEMLRTGVQPLQQTRGWSETKNETIPQREKEEAHDYRYFPEPDIPPMRFTSDQVSVIRDQISELPDAKSARFVKQYGITDYAATILTDDPAMAIHFETAVQLLKPEQSFLVADLANWLINKRVDLSGTTPAELVIQVTKSKEATDIDQNELDKIITEVVGINKKAVTEYKLGKEPALMFLVGQVLRKVKADPRLVKELLKEGLLHE